MSFYVSASNIHTDRVEQFGPFPGNPSLTYEFLRCWSNEDHPLDGEHIFRYTEERNNAHFHRDQDDGEPASYGWRRCFGMPGQFGVENGPIWTDLAVVPTEDDPIRTNELTAHQGDAALRPDRTFCRQEHEELT